MGNLFVRENPTEGDKLDLEAMERSLGFKERRYIEELRILTKSTAVDCVIDNRFERIIYVIKPGDMGFAIGKGGEHIKKLSKVLGKNIEMVEYSESREEFIVNMLKPVEVETVTFPPGSEPVHIVLKDKINFGLAIGKGGANIEKIKILIRRFFGKEIDELEVKGDE